jgi:hypothetical protein
MQQTVVLETSQCTAFAIVLRAYNRLDEAASDTHAFVQSVQQTLERTWKHTACGGFGGLIADDHFE